MANKERRLEALHYLAKMELGSCKIFQGNRKPFSKLITLLSLSSLPQEEDNDDRKLIELRNSVSPTTPLKYSSTIPSSSTSSLEDGSSPPIQPKRPNTLVIKEGNKKQKITQKPKANNRSKTAINRKGKEQVDYPPPREMPKHMFDLITGNYVQGKNIIWFTTKLIYESDILSGHNRLLLPYPEKLELVLRSNEKKCHIKVHVFDPKLVIRKLTMGYWPGQSKYVLITLWAELAAANGLIAEGHLVDIWTFRNQLEELCFALDFRKVRKEADEDPTGAAGTCGASTSGHGGCEGSTSISNNV